MPTAEANAVCRLRNLRNNFIRKIVRRRDLAFRILDTSMRPTRLHHLHRPAPAVFCRRSLRSEELRRLRDGHVLYFHILRIAERDLLASAQGVFDFEEGGVRY